MTDGSDLDLTIIYVMGGVICALIAYVGVLQTLTHRSSVRVRAQVENSHDINMRDDLDGKFESLESSVQAVANMQAQQSRTLTIQARDIGGMREDIRQIRSDRSDDRQEIRDRLREIDERTKPRDHFGPQNEGKS
jgi:hypothetical protein